MRNWELYNGIRVAGCVISDGGCVRQVYGEGVKPDFYTVYLRCTDFTLEAVRDFGSYKAARRYGEKLAAKRGLQIVDLVRGEA